MPLAKQPRAVVTGAGSGFGRAFCLELARRGGRIVISDVDLEAARATAAECSRAEAYAVGCDVAQLAQVENLAAEADRRFGGVDLVINNAGVAVSGYIGEIAIEDWRWLMEINLWGVIHGCHVFVPRLRRQGSGHVLNVASVAGLVHVPGLSPYCVAKAGVVALSECLRAELHDAGIGVTVLCPSFARTNIAPRARGDDRFRPYAAKLVDTAKWNADDVVRVALRAVERDRLHALPQPDARWMWRLKRWLPRRFHQMVPRALALQARQLGLEVPAPRKAD